MLWIAACPTCRVELGAFTGATLHCPRCSERYDRVDGVWRCLPPARADHFRTFIRDYAAVRRGEGRGSDDAEYYRRLPSTLPDDPLAWQWSIRQRTWQHFERHHVAGWPPSTRVVDLGAGVGWASNRLAQAGHLPIAIDLSTDDRDGLCAARHFVRAWPAVHAEFDRVPLTDGQADAVIFNASLHYSTDYHRTMGEALRLLRADGVLYVIDSPLYTKPKAGEQMSAERHADFERRFGTRSDSVASIEYLTRGMLDALAEQHNLEWSMTRPWYGVNWALRPWRARVRRQRQPSRFVVMRAAQRPTSAG